MFHEELRRLRIKEDMTQKELSGFLGVAQTTIANYEKGIRFPDESSLVKLADHFHVTLDEMFGRKKTVSHGSSASDEDYLDLYRNLMDDFKNHDERRAIHHFLNFLPSSRQLDIIEKVLIPALTECGKLWETGYLTIADEHFITEVISGLIIRMSDYFHKHMFHKDSIQVLGVTAGLEKHSLGLQMLMSLLKERGIRTHFIGAQVPGREIMESLEAIKPAVLVLSVNQSDHMETAESLMAHIKNSFPHLKILLGANKFLQKEISQDCADLITHDFLTALLQIEHWAE